VFGRIVDLEGEGVWWVVQVYLFVLAGNMISIESILAVQAVYIQYVYKHIPYFSDKGIPESSTNPAIALQEWATCNIPLHMFVAFLFTLVLVHIEDTSAIAKFAAPSELHVLPLLAKFLGIRVVTDITFYALHRMLHQPPFYAYLHKRHHEHFKTRIHTNFHFTIIDLFLEAFAPFMVGVGVLVASGVDFTLFEISVALVYIGWFEIGSHSGKAMPTVTYYPPLSILYNAIVPIDANNVQFHETHHNLVKCNYGITQWLDIVLGTARSS
jgi:sterol desaturase/sphingolipid hydroxylase (fatty acid hydroxylase superfamily)